MSEKGCMCWTCSSFGSVALLADSIQQCAKMLCALTVICQIHLIIAEQMRSVLLASFGGSCYYQKLSDGSLSHFSAADVHVIAAPWGSVVIQRNFLEIRVL